MEKVIYQIRNLINDKLYIGSTKNFKSRRRDHMRNLNKNISNCGGIQNAWNKYGEVNFIIEIIDYVDNDIDLVWVEEQYILLYDTIKNGYNIRLPYSEQNRGKDSYVKAGMSHSEWYKDNPQLGGYPIISLDKDGNIVDDYISTFQAEKHYLSSDKMGSLRRCAKFNSGYTKLHKSNGLYWYFKADFDKNRFMKLLEDIKRRKVDNARSMHRRVEKIIPYSERNIKRTPIKIQNIKNREILTFKGIADCARFLKANSTKIHELVKGYQNKGRRRISKINSLKGYTFIDRVV